MEATKAALLKLEVLNLFNRPTVRALSRRPDVRAG